MSTSATQVTIDAVFHMHEITKVYHMGDLTVPAPRGITLESFARRIRRHAGPIREREIDTVEHSRWTRAERLGRSDLIGVRVRAQ